MPVPLAGEIVAIPLHEFAAPAAAVVAANEPEKPASDAVNVCALPEPVARKDKLDGVSVGGAGDAVGDGVGDAVGDGDGVGDCAGIGPLTADAVPPEPLHAYKAPSATAIAAARNPCPCRSPIVSSSGHVPAMVTRIDGAERSEYGALSYLARTSEAAPVFPT